MVVSWLLQRVTRNAGIVDVAWSGGMGVAALFYALTSDGDFERRWLLGVLAGVWSLRLTSYLFFDRFLGKPEDGRYQMLRQRWSPREGLYFFGFFQLQALWVVYFSLPFLVVAHHIGPLDVWSVVGLTVWCIAVAGEFLADLQLARFRSDPSNAGKTCRRGLWRYSRHPNYFFEWVHWWSYVFLSVGSFFLWLSFVVMGTMYWFLLKVTGIPYTEMRALETRGDDYRDYQRRTSAFIPWKPRNLEQTHEFDGRSG